MTHQETVIRNCLGRLGYTHAYVAHVLSYPDLTNTWYTLLLPYWEDLQARGEPDMTQVPESLW